MLYIKDQLWLGNDVACYKIQVGIILLHGFYRFDLQNLYNCVSTNNKVRSSCLSQIIGWISQISLIILFAKKILIVGYLVKVLMSTDKGNEVKFWIVKYLVRSKTKNNVMTYLSIENYNDFLADVIQNIWWYKRSALKI